MRIAIDARLMPGRWGGVEPVLQGLAHGLSSVGDGHEIGFLAYDGHLGWLAPFVRGPCRIIPVRPPATSRTSASLPGFLRPIVPTVKQVLRALRPISRELGAEPPEVRAFAPEVVHFALQSGFRTNRANVYHPHDLQHVHFPGNFTRDELAVRNYVYSTMARQADTIVALSAWGADDIRRHLPVQAGAIPVIPWATPPETGGDAPEMDAASRLGIHGPFAIYPAQTWPHKNHRTLLHAWAHLTDTLGSTLQLACTGVVNSGGRDLPRLVESLGLTGRVHLLGHVPRRSLAGLLRSARLLAYPSLFEGWGLPIAEAFSLGIPVVCSDAGCMPEVAGGAARLCDPTCPRSIAEAVFAVDTDVSERSALITRGTARAGSWSWAATARLLLEVYRNAAVSAAARRNAP